MQRDKKTYSIKDVLESYLAKNKHIGYRIKSAEALRVWGRICGDLASSHSEAVHVKDGILLVKTDSPSLANELSFKQQEFIEKINEELSSPLIKKIVFKSGFVGKNSSTAAEPSKSIDKKKKLTMETVKRVDKLVETVKEKKAGVGLNAATGEYEDMVKAGVLDPAKVTRTALQNAASVAGVLLTAETVVTELPKKEDEKGAAPEGVVR